MAESATGPWWQSVPAMLGGVAALVTAAGGVFIALASDGEAGPSTTATATAAQVTCSTESELERNQPVRVSAPPGRCLQIRSLPSNHDGYSHVMGEAICVSREGELAQVARYEDEGFYWRQVRFDSATVGWVTDGTLSGSEGPVVTRR